MGGINASIEMLTKDIVFDEITGEALLILYLVPRLCSDGLGDIG